VSKAVKKAISLPADLAAEVEAIAREENKSLSAVVQDALRALKRSRLRGEFRELQGYGPVVLGLQASCLRGTLSVYSVVEVGIRHQHFRFRLGDSRRTGKISGSRRRARQSQNVRCARNGPR